jgi:hypothetical protein
VFSVFVRQANGVAQASGDEPEQYWPRNTGPISASSLAATDGDRAVSELSRWADRLLLVKGTRFAFPDSGCAHAGGGAQVLTAAQVSAKPSAEHALALGESVDNRLARAHAVHGGEPLTLYTGPRRNYIEEVLSYRGPLDRRSAEDDPYSAYLRMVGGGEATALLAGGRQSVNDLISEQMAALLARTDLSSTDRGRLERHQDSIRDFELLACQVSAEDQARLAEPVGAGTLNDNRMSMARLHMDLIALAFSCDHVRSATLQIGDGNDHTEYTIDGEKLASYHQISHRVFGDFGRDGEPMEGAAELHHKIDRLFLQQFDHLLSALQDHGVLDQCIAVHTNDLGTPNHGYSNIPWAIVGPPGGLLALGQYVDVGGATHNRLFNTLLSAAGLRGADGGWVDDFGDPSLEGGVLTALIA